MGLSATALAYIGTAVSAAGAAGSYVQQNKAAAEQEKAREVQKAQQELRDRRERLRIIREERIKRAQMEAIGANTGVANSSGVQGGTASLQSQAGANLNAVNQNATLANYGSEYLQRAQDAQTVGSVFGTLGAIGQGVANDYGGYKTIFSDLNKRFGS